MNNRAHRALIAQDTLTVLERGYYRNRLGEKVAVGDAVSAAVAGSIHYSSEQLRRLVDADGSAQRFDTRFEVRNESTLAAARRLLSEGCDEVLCLNFASARNPGGGFLGGSEAQEENLVKSSGLYPCIERMQALYELNRRTSFCAYNDDMIYSPRVPVFRDDDYGYLDQPFLASFVTAPAVNRGAVARNEPGRLGELEGIMLGRIAKLLSLALHHGHKTLVLGAWGCGVFGNEPATMAAWFARLLRDDAAYVRAFETVCFAVLDRRQDGTFAAFQAQFAPRYQTV